VSAALAERYYAPEEYLALERQADTRSEYLHGRIFAMAGASVEHNVISGNVFVELHNRFRDRPCQAFASDMRVKVSDTGLYTYPDVVALCGEPRFEDAEVDTLLNPQVIVEVLSPKTEAYDRGEKFAHYRRLESAQEYVLIAQDRVRVEHYVRQGEQWLLTELDALDDVLRLPAVACEISLRAIYAKIDFPIAKELAQPEA
jgi:Uma2 family endonuclease